MVRVLGEPQTVAQTRKDALTTHRLEHAVKALGTGLKGQRDRALLLLTFACALRRAEAPRSTSSSPIMRRTLANSAEMGD